MNPEKTNSPDRVVELAQEAADRRNLRTQQTKLYLAQKKERLAAPLRRRAKKVMAQRHAARARVHFGAASRFTNGVKNTFASEGPRGEDRLYFQFESGQMVRADKIVRRGKNPVVKALVLSEIEANAKRST